MAVTEAGAPETDLGSVPARPVVVAIVGAGRSGSTLLGALLGQSPGVVNAGEVRYLWERGFVEQRLCGCGKPVPECPVWSRVAEQVGPAALANMRKHQRRHGRIRHVPIALAGRVRPAIIDRRAGALVDPLGHLYRAIAAASGCQVIVDSSKLPLYTQIVQRVPDLDVKVIHLVRDARATAFSWQRKKALADGAPRAFKETMSPGRSAALWTIWNALGDGLFPDGADLRRVRYEDLVEHPRRTLEELHRWIGTTMAEHTFIDEHRVVIAPTHTVAGNADRMRTGTVSIRPDDEWRHAQADNARRLVTAISWPLLVRHRYPVLDPIGRTALHMRFLRTRGLGALVEEKRISPPALASGLVVSVHRRRQRIEPGTTTPLWLLGAQRSGTNMLVDAFRQVPEVEIRNETDRGLFRGYELCIDRVDAEVAQCRSAVMLVKALCDSHRARWMLEPHGTDAAPRIMWMFRGVDARARSAVTRFGHANQHALRAIVAGCGDHLWQAGGLSQENRVLLGRLGVETLDPLSAAALFWYLRNCLFFDLALDDDPAVAAVSYQRLVDDPAGELQWIARFAGVAFRPAMAAHVHGPRESAGTAAIEPRVRDLCDEMETRLAAVYDRQRPTQRSPLGPVVA
jgi:Sulfotransferase family